MIPFLARPTVRSAALAVVLAGAAACSNAAPGRTQQAPLDSLPTSRFAALSQQLSESGGYFDTDNLISNESSYLHVVDALRDARLRGGAYLGVGPGQNFSYIAQIRPDVAFIVDIRRDNLLQHLLYKALFGLAPRRVDFLGALVGRDVSAAPVEAVEWSIEELVAFLDGPIASARAVPELTAAVRTQVRGFGMDLSEDDLATIERFHRAFIERGLNLRFNTFGRAPQPYYPTLRDLLLERDRSGSFRNYLAREDDFRFVKDLQRRNLVVPVVGDLSGSHALRAIGAWLNERAIVVSAFYTSNVEFYLWGDGTFRAFAENVAALPRDRNSVLIRSYFGARWRVHPLAVPGYASTQLLQSMNDFVSQWRAGRYRSYLDLVRTP